MKKQETKTGPSLGRKNVKQQEIKTERAKCGKKQCEALGKWTIRAQCGKDQFEAAGN